MDIKIENEVNNTNKNWKGNACPNELFIYYVNKLK
jgi:hypothetical protein